MANRTKGGSKSVFSASGMKKDQLEWLVLRIRATPRFTPHIQLTAPAGQGLMSYPQHVLVELTGKVMTLHWGRCVTLTMMRVSLPIFC